MFWWLYNVVFAVLYLLLVPRFLLRMAKRGGYREDFLERFGIFSESKRSELLSCPRVWMHAVSVGEIQVALRFADEIRRRVPGTAFVFSVTTSTAHRIAEKRLTRGDVLIYFPVDIPVFVTRVMDLVRPVLIVLTESELWPNMLRLAGARSIPVIMVNGRVSMSSYRGYRLVRPVLARVLRVPATFLVQTDGDGRRLIELGAPADRVCVAGSVKYDDPGADDAGLSRIGEILSRCGVSGPDKVVLLGGSTWAGEEAILLGITARLRETVPGLRLILVPRHAERRQEVENAVRARGFNCVLRSGLEAGSLPVMGAGDVLLVDSTGELKYFYGCASVVFVGKSLTEHGGQNIVEPAVMGKPIIVGPNMENFPEIIEDFLSAGAIRQVADATGLEKGIRELVMDRQLRTGLGDKARALVVSRRGALNRSLDLIIPLLQKTPAAG